MSHARSSPDPREAWFLDQGSRFLGAERRVLSRLLADGIGGQVIQMGPLADGLLDAAPAVARHVLQAVEGGRVRGAFVACAEELPLESDSVQMVLCHHAQECLSDPGRLLQECHRILRGGGLLLLMGFGMKQTLPRGCRRVPMGKLRSALAASQWELRRPQPVNVGEDGLGRLLDWCARRLPPSCPLIAPLSEGFALVAKKRSGGVPVMRLRSRERPGVNGVVSGSATRA